MPELARQEYTNRYYNYNYSYNSNIRYDNRMPIHTSQTPVRRVKREKRPQKKYILQRAIAIGIVSLIGCCILPFGFNKVTKMMLNPTPYKEVKADMQNIVFPTSNYIANDWFMGQRALRGAQTKKPLMAPLKEGTELVGLENSLKNLASAYPSIHPSIYVWDFDSGNYAELNADESFPTASIIKLPVLVQLFRSIEKNQLTIYDEMPLTEYYRTEGSGSLQFKAANSKYSIDTLARMMITESDNSATNMIMARIGSMTDVNSGIRQWGLKNTYVQTWLPDLQGTNRSTAHDMARILYNIDNPDFLSTASREKIFDYMGHVHNNRLIAAGLPANAEFLHKTGDIGKMLGDAGIVYTPNNKKYIVVIFANRPHNSPLGKEFIVKASEIIYNNMTR